MKIKNIFLTISCNVTSKFGGGGGVIFSILLYLPVIKPSKSNHPNGNQGIEQEYYFLIKKICPSKTILLNKTKSRDLIDLLILRIFI